MEIAQFLGMITTTIINEALCFYKLEPFLSNGDIVLLKMKIWLQMIEVVHMSVLFR